MRLPIEFKKLNPSISKTEKELVKKEGYTYAMIVSRRKEIREARSERMENMRKARADMAEVGKMRSMEAVGGEEWALIEKEFIEKEPGEEVKTKYLSDKYRIWPMDMDKYAAAHGWARKREQWQRVLAASRGKRDTPAEVADKAGGVIITTMEKQEREAMAEFKIQNRTEKAIDRSLQLLRLRHKIAKALRITEADYAIYKDDPKKLIRENDNLIADPVQVKNLTSLVQSFKSVIELEREEDGWVNGRGIGGGLIQGGREEEDREILEVSFDMPELPKMEQLIHGEVVEKEEDIFSD